MDDLLSSALFLPASDSSLLVQLGKDISFETHSKVAWLSRLLVANKSRFISNAHPAYNSVLVTFDPSRTDHVRAEEEIRNLARDYAMPPESPRLVVIPACYGSPYGPDLEDVAGSCGLSTAEVIQMHSKAEYLVYFLGFTPGFPYLGGLPAKLTTPRLQAPRKSVPAGSIAIGGNQTGIYPVNSPGGWRIIGRTPLRLFDEKKETPSLLRLGDRVRFEPISSNDFEKSSQTQ